MLLFKNDFRPRPQSFIARKLLLAYAKPASSFNRMSFLSKSSTCVNFNSWIREADVVGNKVAIWVWASSSTSPRPLHPPLSFISLFFPSVLHLFVPSALCSFLSAFLCFFLPGTTTMFSWNMLCSSKKWPLPRPSGAFWATLLAQADGQPRTISHASSGLHWLYIKYMVRMTCED